MIHGPELSPKTTTDATAIALSAVFLFNLDILVHAHTHTHARDHARTHADTNNIYVHCIYTHIHVRLCVRGCVYTCKNERLKDSHSTCYICEFVNVPG